MTLLDHLEPVTTAGGGHPGQWRLSHIELVNWGTFEGHHRIDIARQGHLFTGASGSGKSSLLDAIAAVLTPDHWLRFNAAAQEGTSGRGDRSLVSYVRGAWSKEADEHLDRAVSTYLRYENGRDAPVTLARAFHLRGASIDSADLKDVCILTRDELPLLSIAEHVAGGIEARRMKDAFPGADITTTGKHASFYSKLRRVLGIRDENALQLLHKTQSAKNLGSLDVLFRTFMLERPATFARASNAVEQFGELSQAHDHVVDLRNQAEHLGAMDSIITDYDTAHALAVDAERLSALLPAFETGLRRELAGRELTEIQASLARGENELQRAELRRDACENALDAAKMRAAQLGGADATLLREHVDDANRRVVETEGRSNRLAERLASVGVAMPTTIDERTELVASATRELEQDAPSPVDYALSDALSAARREREALDRELTELRARPSNLPAELQRARRAIASELGVPESTLPFGGELLEVVPEFAEWTGAIERVLAPLSRSLLVRDDLLTRVRRCVDSLHLGTRLVFDSVPRNVGAPQPTRATQPLIHRVHVVEGGFADYLQHRLAQEFDYSCVDNADGLESVDRGVTIAGQIKRQARRYEKNDRHRIDDRRQWVMGADNESKIELLIDARREAERAIAAAAASLEQLQKTRDAVRDRRGVLAQVVAMEWSDVDVSAARDAAAALLARYNDLAADSELRGAIEHERALRVEFMECTASANLIAQKVAGARELIADLSEQITQLDREISTTEPLAQGDYQALDQRYRAIQRSIRLSSVSDVSLKVSTELSQQLRRAESEVSAAETKFGVRATEFRLRWAAASADLTESIEDRAAYRALLSGIVARGLPEHEANFLKLLKDKSRDLIAHLLADIRDAPKEIGDRIDPVNASLGRSRFDVDRFLRIEVKVRRGGEVEEFIRDLRQIADGNWADGDLASAEIRFTVLRRIMQRLASSDHADRAWRNRCLDTREHVTFMAHEVDAEGHSLQVHDSSAGLSGGQRQKLVIFCLAAALRYQLASEEDEFPSYATIVLDEAFDKADTQYTRMAMDVFVTFGFHMILATPQKLLQTIEAYVGAVTSVTNPTRKSSQLATALYETVPE